MLSSIQFHIKHLTIIAIVIFTCGCSSISLKSLYTSDDADPKKETSIDENSMKYTTPTEQDVNPKYPKLNNIPLVKETDFDDNISAEEIQMVEASGTIDKSKMQTDSWKLDNACPDLFYDVKIPLNGKYCQTFAAELPASLIFFVPMLPSETVQFFIDKNKNFDIKKQVKSRILLTNSDNSKTLVVSPDGVGSQVDILIK